jgi:hypothetical protein
MRPTAARAAVAIASLATALSIALPVRGGDPKPPATPGQYLNERGAHVIEDLSDKDLLATIKLDRTRNWKRRLIDLARVEAGRRGLTNDPFPVAYSGPYHHRTPMAATAAEVEILARIVHGESTGEMSQTGRVAIASVVLNRVVSKGFPGTIEAVAHQPLQFSSYNASTRDRYDSEVPQSCWQAAREALKGTDPVNGATFYFNPYVVRPDWADDLKFIKRLGDSPTTTHDFYRQ